MPGECRVAEPVIGPRFARTRWLLAMTGGCLKSKMSERKWPGQSPAMRYSSGPRRRLIRIQREARRSAAEVRGRIERLALERAVVVLGRERRGRRIGVVGELAVARQHFGTAIEPGALAHIN